MRRPSASVAGSDVQGRGPGRFRRAVGRHGRTATAPADALTGCEPLESLAGEYELMARRAKRDHSHVALLTCDIDAFTRINDEFGRSRGDSVLAAFAARVQQTVRASDHVYRSGGEEFVVAAYGADADGARIAAERVRDAVAAQPCSGVEVSVSIGVAIGLDPGEGHSELFAQSTAAMREAKKHGRGQIVVAG